MSAATLHVEAVVATDVDNGRVAASYAALVQSLEPT